MTRTEAISEMKSGRTVTHRHFSDDEFIRMEGMQIVTEEGYKFDADEFWAYRTAAGFDEGWSIKED